MLSIVINVKAMLQMYVLNVEQTLFIQGVKSTKIIP